MLVALWERKRAEDGKLMTIRELHAALKERLGPNEAPSHSAVKNAVRGLQSRHEPLLMHDKVPREHGEAGPSPTGFAISSWTIMTWPTTAVIALRLFNYPSHEGMAVERFIDDIMQLHLIHDETKQPLTREDIVGELDYCKRLAYIAEDPEWHRLRVTDRVNAERLFLEQIAEQAERLDEGEVKRGIPPRRRDMGTQTLEQKRTESGSSQS